VVPSPQPSPAEAGEGVIDLHRRLLGFCALLREHGFPVTLAHSTAALRAVMRVDVGDRTDFNLALKAVLVSSREQVAPFDDLFAFYWDRRPEVERRETAIAEPEAEAVASATPEGMYSAMETLATKDFGDLQAGDDIAAVEKAVRQIARKLATRRGRRQRPARHGQVDLRRTMRRSLRLGGTALELQRRRRDVRKARLVLLCDVSRSMDQYSRFLLQFVYAFQRALGRVDSFVFGTRLTPVTRYFRTSGIDEAIERISGEVPDWSGGTRIGASLEVFNRGHRAAVDSSTTVVVLSDGLDTGDMALLEAEMAALHRRARRLIWLNPLLAADQPLGRGMRAALPYVDTLAPANNLASLEAFGRMLR
jgi:uncharacterized protein with von Willebrand factor type A (vWA) domain